MVDTVRRGRSDGVPIADPAHAVDPRLVAVANLPGVRFIVERDAVAAAEVGHFVQTVSERLIHDASS